MPSSWVTFGSRDDFPEDAEKEDKEAIKEMAEALMASKYPPFSPEIVHTFNKDYYLPALKVLERDSKGSFFSPSRTAEWVDNELVAECKSERGGITFQLTVKGYELVDPKPMHKAPDESCDCGIYGSVHMEEVRGYLEKEDVQTKQVMYYGSWQGGPPQILEEKKNVLCIIEPSEDAEVILCRKGWKASKAFISEVVGETISIAEASQLLSMAWQRNIDVRRVFNEDR